MWGGWRGCACVRFERPEATRIHVRRVAAVAGIIRNPWRQRKLFLWKSAVIELPLKAIRVKLSFESLPGRVVCFRHVVLHTVNLHRLVYVFDFDPPGFAERKLIVEFLHSLMRDEYLPRMGYAFDA